MFEKYDFKEVEESVRKKWKENHTRLKIKAKFQKYPKFFFLDGPPYATGFIHMGTAWNKILKDVYIRFIRMRGNDVWDQPGYDTHGTPIEVKVEKELGFKSKKDIEKHGVEKFIQKCRDFATRYIDVMNEQFENLGVWMDFDHPYLTLSNEYMEGAWHTFKVAYSKGLLYKGSYPVHVCPRCETAVAYNEIEYMKKKDPSIYVKFKRKDAENEYFVIWTTTPWTLPANTAIMVHPNYEYAKVKISSNEVWIIAKDLVQKLMKRFNIKNYEIIDTLLGKELEGIAYEHPLLDKIPKLKEVKKGHKIITNAMYVNLDEGTGLVHVAPGHGREDYKAALPYKIEIIAPLNLDGTYKEEMGDELKGKFAYDANPLIIEWLKDKNALIKEEVVEHDYPKCWRCSTPLLLMAVPQWFFKISSIKDKLLKENEEVDWHPDWAKKRFKAWLENLEDWPISRQRYWGIPLPIWECEKCGNIEVIGSLRELKDRAGIKEIKDIHRPYIDEITIKCEKCGSDMKRIPDVLDVWFDSGVASWASLGYPERKDLFEKLWPSKLQIEGADQIRGWWNSQLITSVITFDRRPFERIIFHGLVLDAKGVKMSKSIGNVITPEEAIEKYGRDALRLYLLTSPPWNNFYFNWQELEKIHRFLQTYWNIYQFVQAYANIQTDEPLERYIEKHFNKFKVEDKWIMSELQEIIHFKEFEELHKLANKLIDYSLHQFSRGYIKMIRDRVAINYEGDDKTYAQATLQYVFNTLNKLFAPFIPHLTEYIYKGNEESVHAELLPTHNPALYDESSIRFIESLDQAVEEAARLRQENKVKQRYPVLKVGWLIKDKQLIKIAKENEELLKRIFNTKQIVFERVGKCGNNVCIDFEETEELKEERFIRELIRHIQMIRKKKGKKIEEKAKLEIQKHPVIVKYLNTLEKETNSSISLSDQIEEPDDKVSYKDLSTSFKVF
ncbi:MAG: isoleucine--tRNA ligase [Candidatus Nanohaloarchaeota archaeon]|nr:isoleucine--tRNA ligase [Candidatus Nanohaloarchaeota archaeon]